MKWTEEENRILMEMYPECSNPRDLANQLNRTYSSLRNQVKKLKIKRRANAKIGKKPNTNFDLWIKDSYLSIPIKAMAREIGKSSFFVRYRMEAMGLVVPSEITKQRKQLTTFKNGHTPASKGKKQSEFMSPEGMERAMLSRFKKGNKPHNIKDVYQYVSVRDYKFIRLDKMQWVLYHKYLWEQANGKVPEGYLLTFKDGNKMNCELDNIVLISKIENLNRNTINNYPKEIQQIIKIQSKLKKAINEKQN